MSRQNKLSRGFLLLFFLPFLLTACGGAEIDIDAPAETITEQPTSIPIEAPIPTPTIVPTPTISPEQQELLSEAKERFNQEGLGFNDYYELEFVLGNGQVIAQSPYDIPGDPYFTFDAESSEWVDNQPGRSDIEKLFPETTEEGRSIWFEFQGFEWDAENKRYLSELNPENIAVWDQEMMAYRYQDGLDVDKGHEQYYQPLMALEDHAEADIKEGRVTFAETIESEDFVLGKSGVRLDFFISADHPYIKWYENLPADLSDQLYSKMFLDNFSWLKGQRVTIRVVAKNITGSSNSNQALHREQTFAQGDFVRLVDGVSAGFTPEVVVDINLATTSIVYSLFENDYDGDEGAYATAILRTLVWALRVQQDGRMNEEYINEGYKLVSGAREQIKNLSGLSGPDTAIAELKD